ncbi:MAG TPA: glycosyltransferase, partial [Candidatus Acidoferrales bacterium]|nr:glycosyltransferase [Candidatus Acidoferrales bacterium]
NLPSVDAFLVGFQGQLDMILLRRLLFERRRIVFAPLVTLSETLIEDRQVYSPASTRASVVRWLDRASLRAATRVVFDTDTHRTAVARAFDLPSPQTAVWHLGCDSEAFTRRPPREPDGIVRVLFYGSFLPLHGVQTILEAAALLADEPHIQFELAGDGSEYAAATAYVRRHRLGNVRLSAWRSYESLADLIAGADICLGIFGGSQKAQMVIPNKVYQCANVGRPIITGDTPAIREVFAHGETIWLCPPGSPAALAEAVRTLSRDTAVRLRLGRHAADLLAERFSPLRQADALSRLLGETAQS